MEIEEDNSEESQETRNESSEEEDEYNKLDNALYNKHYIFTDFFSLRIFEFDKIWQILQEK